MTAAQRLPMSRERPRPRAAAWIAWSLWGAAVVLTVSAMILVVVTRSVPHSAYDQWHLSLLRMPGQLAFATVGFISPPAGRPTRSGG